MDGWPDLDLTILNIVENKLAPGALVIADNVGFESSKPYLEYVRNPENGYVSVASPLGECMELSTSCKNDLYPTNVNTALAAVVSPKSPAASAFRTTPRKVWHV